MTEAVDGSIASMTVAAQTGDINALYALIGQDPNILEHIDAIPFVNTPLHEAASAGHTHFALEIIGLMPSFGRKLNPDGFSPLDLALRNEYVKTVERLIKVDSELIRVKGRNRLTPLHYVAEKNEENLLLEFLKACPESIEDLTIREETALHIAVKNSSLQVFLVILKWLQSNYNEEVLTLADEEGNTVLHVAVSTNQPQIVKSLVKKAAMIKNKKNLEGFTALDIALSLGDDEGTQARNILRRAKAAKAAEVSSPSNVEIILIGWLNILRRVDAFWSRAGVGFTKENRSDTIVVAVLIATATFQAVLSPPGGGGSQDLNNSTMNCSSINTTMTTNTTTWQCSWSTQNFFQSDTKFFEFFYYFNTIAFGISVSVIIAVLQLSPRSAALHGSLLFMMISYGQAMVHVAQSSRLVVVVTTVLTVFSSIAFVLKNIRTCIGLCSQLQHALARESSQKPSQETSVATRTCS